MSYYSLLLVISLLSSHLLIGCCVDFQEERRKIREIGRGRYPKVRVSSWNPPMGSHRHASSRTTGSRFPCRCARIGPSRGLLWPVVDKPKFNAEPNRRVETLWNMNPFDMDQARAARNGGA